MNQTNSGAAVIVLGADAITFGRIPGKNVVYGLAGFVIGV
jgi:hypothetical protein